MTVASFWRVGQAEAPSRFGIWRRENECSATLSGHMKAVTCLASFSGSDGAPLLASGSRDEKIIVWDVVTHNQLATLSGHTDCVMALAVFSSALTGYQCLASGCYDGTIMLWDPREYRTLATLCGHEDAVWSLCVWRDSFGADRLASGSYDMLIRVWDLSTHRILFTLVGHEGPVRCLSFFSNADTVPMLASADFTDHTLRVWDLESRVAVARVHGSASTESLICIAGVDGRVLAACTSGEDVDRAVRLYDLSTGRPVVQVPLDAARACLSFVDRASGVPYLAVSGEDTSDNAVIHLIC
jgi:WD40 repeat protein